MKQFMRSLAGVGVFTLLFFGVAIVIGIVLGGSGTLGTLLQLALQPIGMLGITIIVVLALSLAYYMEMPWVKLEGIAKKYEALSIKPQEEGEEYFACIFEEGAGRLANAEARLARMSEGDRNIDQKSLYLAETEQALLNILEDVEEANTKLKELDHLKTDFLNVTSHELRTPLTPLVAYADMMEQGKLGPLTEEQKQALSVIKRNANRLRLLITDILDIAKLEGRRMKYQMQLASLNRLVSTVISEQQSTARNRNIVLKAEGIPQLPKMKIDTTRIMQVLNNLIGNAIKFSPDGTDVIVRARLTPKEVIISVTDHGIGIPADDIPKLFNMFYQSRRTMTRNAEGSGLGLAISRWIVTDHGGSIWVSSKEGAGSTFAFALPRKYSPSTQGAGAAVLESQSLDEMKGGGKKQ